VSLEAVPALGLTPRGVALWDCVPLVCGGGGGCVSLEAVPALSWRGGGVSRGQHIIIDDSCN